MACDTGLELILYFISEQIKLDKLCAIGGLNCLKHVPIPRDIRDELCTNETRENGDSNFFSVWFSNGQTSLNLHFYRIKLQRLS